MKANRQTKRCMALLILGFLSATLPAHAEITTVRIATGLEQPLFADSPPADSERLFVVQRTGDIKIINLADGSVNAQPFLSVTGMHSVYGLAFHPDYENNGLFYVNSVDTVGKAVLQQYQVSATNPDRANLASKKVILSYQRHNEGTVGHSGGWIDFSPVDGYLYISTGDGGKAAYRDKDNRSQDITKQRLGKILRIDVNGADQFPSDSSRNYAVPSSNPFVNKVGDDEIWAYGLRNPWRPSFDQLTGDLYIADVGQDDLEEVNFQPASSDGGTNYGWRLREGTLATPTGSFGGPKPPGAIDPFYEYSQGNATNQGSSVTGGYVYNGPIESLVGKYFLADYASNRVWSVQHDGSNPANHNGNSISEFIDWTDEFSPDAGVLDSIASFGEDGAGNLYRVGIDGEVFRVTAEGDYQGDLDVDGGDFLRWQRAESSVAGLAEWQDNFGKVGAATANIAVPEPGSIALFLLALLTSQAIAKRKRPQL